MITQRTEHYDRDETLVVVRRVAHRVSARLPSIQAAVESSTADLLERGVDPDTVEVRYAPDGVGGGVVSYETDVTAYPPPPAGSIPAYLPRDWPGQVAAIVDDVETDDYRKIQLLHSLLDGWVLAATGDGPAASATEPCG